MARYRALVRARLFFFFPPFSDIVLDTVEAYGGEDSRVNSQSASASKRAASGYRACLDILRAPCPRLHRGVRGDRGGT